eukprot:3207199-Prymnesium_polylepis.1
MHRRATGLEPALVGDLDDRQPALDGAGQVGWVEGAGLRVGDEDLLDAGGERERLEAHIEHTVVVKVQERDRLLARHEAQVGLVENERRVDLGVELAGERLQAPDRVERLDVAGPFAAEHVQAILGLAEARRAPHVEGGPDERRWHDLLE